jgi:hypothetical protein
MHRAVGGNMPLQPQLWSTRWGSATKPGKVTGEKLSDKAVVRLVKHAAADSGLDPEKFAGHSLRRGLLTAAGGNHASLLDMMRQSRHRSVQSVIGYVAAEDLWWNNVTEGVFRNTHQVQQPAETKH